MGLPAIRTDEHFTYRQYKTWPDDERWELIHGVAYNMSPAPLRRHQELLGRLYMQVGKFLEGKPCKVYFAPFEVLMPQGNEDEDEVDTVVQPDLVVYCRHDRLTEKGARGAPDLAVEIVSPYTSAKDHRIKFALYEEQGVREYWIADPAGAWINCYVLNASGRFDDGTLYAYESGRPGPVMKSIVLEGFSLDLAVCFGSG